MDTSQEQIFLFVYFLELSKTRNWLDIFLYNYRKTVSILSIQSYVWGYSLFLIRPLYSTTIYVFNFPNLLVFWYKSRSKFILIMTIYTHVTFSTHKSCKNKSLTKTTLQHIDCSQWWGKHLRFTIDHGEQVPYTLHSNRL